MKVVRQTLPGAWICTNDPSLNYPNHGRKSIQHNKIYLQDGEEFEIELYNPMSENVLAVISLDGKPISSSGIVIRAGQRFYLDCFYDDQKKFVFKTYEVDNTSEAQEAIAKNGLFEVQFFKEKILKKYEADKIVQHHHHYHYRNYPYWNGWYNGFYYVNGNLTTGSTITAGTTYNTFTTNAGSGSLNINATNTGTTSYNATNASYTSDAYTANVGATYSDNANETLTFASLSGNVRSKKTTETGQVDKGNASSQTFTTIDMDFEDSILNKISYQLLPESRQPLTMNTIENSKIKLNDDIEMNGTVKINGKEIGTSKISQLLELKAMLETKLINQDEFDILKTELLS